jgi:phage antirepressor YoqD-like protein
MNDINMSQMTASEVIEQVETATSIEPLRKLARQMEISFSGNTGIETLREKILKTLEKFVQSNPANRRQFDEETEEEEVEKIEVAKTVNKPTVRKADMLDMNPSTIEDVNLRRQVIRAQALRLVRVKIQNLDPNDAPLSGAIISLQNKYTGKVAKYVPFGEESENGYHIPWMMYEHLKQWKFPLRKEVKGGRFGVKTYKTVMVPKFSIEILPPLTAQELQELANLQRASQSIDTGA